MPVVICSGIGPIPAMDEPVGDRRDSGGLSVDDRDASVYRYATRFGAITLSEVAAAELGLTVSELHCAMTRLVELRLLRADATAGDRLLPTDPELAAALLISPIERAMYQRRDLADRLRDRIDIIARPEPDAAQPVGAIDGLTGVTEIRGLFKLAAEVCRGELMVLRPNHDDEGLLDELLDACYGVLDRDIAVRVVCSHRSRADFVSRARVKRLTGGGAQIRTLSQVPRAAVVFDHTLAVTLSLPEPGGQPGARRVRDRDVVRFLVEMFDQLWDAATPFAPDEPGYARTVDDLQQSIARLMAQGLTDEVVARRLGMSVRACRRHIAALLRNLDAVSRFQAGVRAADKLAINGARGA